MSRGDREEARDGGRPVRDRLLRTRRLLPHWQTGGATYFLTYRCASGRILADPDRAIVVENWKHWDGVRYHLHAIVVMPDHVHVLITPLNGEDRSYIPLSEILHTNKSFSSHAINRRTTRTGALWQEERYDRIVRDEEEFLEKWNYMSNNPVEAGLCRWAEDYPWWYGNPADL